MYRNLLFLKSYEGDVTDLGLDFTVLNDELGETRVRISSKFNFEVNVKEVQINQMKKNFNVP